jgi:hypothetical protein
LLELSGVVSAGASAPEVRKLDNKDLSIVIGAYVDRVVELRPLLLTCSDRWHEASAVLVAALREAVDDTLRYIRLVYACRRGREGAIRQALNAAARHPQSLS